jgi:hypothetical protein
MTAQGSSRTRYHRAIKRKNLMGAAVLLREMGAVTLDEALDYVALLAELRPAKAPVLRCDGTGGWKQRRRCSLCPNRHWRSLGSWPSAHGDREALGRAPAREARAANLDARVG